MANDDGLSLGKRDLERRFSILWADVTGGWMSLCTWRVVSDAVDEDRLNPYNWFLEGVIDGCRREAVMALARIFDPENHHHDHASLRKLLEVAARNPKEFEYAPTSEELIEAVEEKKKWIKKHDLARRIRQLRTKVLAHSDMVGLGDHQAASAVHMSVAEVAACYEEIGEVTNVFQAYFKNHLWAEPGSITAQVTNDFNHLFKAEMGDYAKWKER